MKRGLLDFFFSLPLLTMDMGGYACACGRYAKGVGVWYIYI